jgi:nucleoredoxin
MFDFKRCPPCRGFTPQLVQFYNKHHVSKNFEIIFVSSDQDEAHFNEYYNEMPWLALTFSNRELKVFFAFFEFVNSHLKVN